MDRNSRAAGLCLALSLIGIGSPWPAWGQVVLKIDSAPDSVAVVPNARYRAGWLTRALVGDHHRDLWTTPLKIELLDLDHYAGGLAPLCRSSAFETATLLFAGVDRHHYLFRSADKDPASARLPRALHRTFVAYALQDQMSARHPTGSVVIAPLVAGPGDSAEIQLRVMPDDPRLGEFRTSFAGMLGTIEPRPEGSPETTAGVWRLIERSEHDRVDARAYLEARLVDILVGDADRGADQWKWIANSGAGRRIWKPIAGDRDHAFARMDGLVLWAARFYAPQLQSFDVSYPSLYGLTWSARAMDRRFLVELEKPVWDSVVAAVQHRWSDGAIANAVSRLPPDLPGKHRTWLLRALAQRRDHLPEAADRFYGLVAEFADMHGTDANDVLEIVRHGDSIVLMRLGAPDASAPYLTRTLRRSETREVRAYLHGGDDSAVVRGAAARGIAVRIIGGPGSDAFVDSSRVGAGVVTEFLENGAAPVPGPPARPIVADSCDTGLRTDSIPRDLAEPPKDWGSRWYPMPSIGYQPNIGLLLGVGAVQYGYGFGKSPYARRSTIAGVFATGPRRFRLSYQGDFRDLPHQLWASVDARFSGIDIVRFYGFGNETRSDAPPEFYRVTQRQVTASVSVTALSKHFRGSVGPFFGYTSTPAGQGNVIDSLQPYGAGYFAEVGVLWRFDLDTRDRHWAPRRGIHATLGARYVPAMLDVTSAYGSARAELATYLSLAAPDAPTLALRIGGTRVFGTAPFAAAAFVGGASTVRGYSEQRFAGRSALYGNAELRVFVRRFNILMPGDVGVLGAGDVGRVFQPGEQSHRWHGAAGAGVWIAFIDRASTVTILAARSPEQWSYYATLGFMF